MAQAPTAAINKEHIGRMFEGISPANRAILAGKLGPQLRVAIGAVNKLDKDPSKITPAHENIMRFARECEIAAAEVVILAQDPYPGAGVADGLCFSSQNSQASLENIKKCITNTCHQKCGNDLAGWARQNVIMLNCALTTRVGKSNVHAAAWSSYTDGIIKELNAIRARKIIFILLGGFAKDKAKLIDATFHHVLKWGHPSPVSTVNQKPGPFNFVNCTCFRRANEILAAEGRRQIVWGEPSEPSEPSESGENAERANVVKPVENINDTADTGFDDDTVESLDLTYVFTDGGATKNGKVGCRASWAYCVVKADDATFARPISASGMVSAEEFVATNNRGELMAVVRALKYIVNLEVIPAEIKFCVDSTYTINAITNWAEQWANSVDKIKDKCNLDLVYCARAYLQALRGVSKVTFEHVKGHRKDIDEGSPEWFCWKGNDVCDKLCTVELDKK